MLLPTPLAGQLGQGGPTSRPVPEGEAGARAPPRPWGWPLGGGRVGLWGRLRALGKQSPKVRGWERAGLGLRPLELILRWL